MKTIIKFVEFSQIKAIRNVRTNRTGSAYIGDGRTLVDSICQDGLQDAPMLVERTDFFEIVRGHRRCDAINLIQVERPEEYARLFPSGKVRCAVVSGVTEEEISALKVDFNRDNLSDRYEVVLAASMLFDAGHTEAQVACTMSNVLGDISGARKKRIAELTEKQEQEQDALEKRMLQALIDKEVFEYRRGKVQGLKVYWNNPAVIMDCLYFETYGKLPDGYPDGSKLPVLTLAQVTTLSKQWKADLELARKGEITQPTSVSPSHCWLDLFKSISLEIDKKVDKRKSAPVKSMSRNDIIKPLETGKIASEAMGNLLKFHAADKSVDASIVTTIDRDLQIVAYAKKHMETEWNTIEVAFRSNEKQELARQVAAAQKAGEEL